jgi:glycine cleavage system transcriptional repressor
MKKLVALSAIGQDRPGIVAALTRVLFETGCNLEDSSMTQLKGDFAVLLLVDLPPKTSLDTLKVALKPVLDQWQLASTLRQLSPAETDGSAGTGFPYTLVVYGVDHPGIVYRMTQAAADLSINITDLRTHMTQSGGRGINLYSLAVEVLIPGKEALNSFQKELESLKKELKVEIKLNPTETDEL